MGLIVGTARTDVRILNSYFLILNCRCRATGRLPLSSVPPCPAVCFEATAITKSLRRRARARCVVRSAAGRGTRWSGERRRQVHADRSSPAETPDVGTFTAGGRTVPRSPGVGARSASRRSTSPRAVSDLTVAGTFALPRPRPAAGGLTARRRRARQLFEQTAPRSRPAETLSMPGGSWSDREGDRRRARILIGELTASLTDRGDRAPARSGRTTAAAALASSTSRTSSTGVRGRESDHGAAGRRIDRDPAKGRDRSGELV